MTPGHEIVIGQIKAVPEMYWHADERYFGIHGLTRFRGFVRFQVTSRHALDHRNFGASSEESTQLICFCDLQGPKQLRVSLFTKAEVRSNLRRPGFICPFDAIASYGPLGDPFSLSVISGHDEQKRSVSITHRDQRHDYTVVANVSMADAPCYQIEITLVQPESKPVVSTRLRYPWQSRRGKTPSPGRQNEKSEEEEVELPSVALIDDKRFQ